MTGRAQALFNPEDPAIPEFAVAVKELKNDPTREEQEELMKEATVSVGAARHRRTSARGPPYPVSATHARTEGTHSVPSSAGPV